MADKQEKKHRGVYQNPPGSGIFWIHYYDAEGKRHREKIGSFQKAVDAYVDRKLEIRGGKFTPPSVRDKLPFGELIDAALEKKRSRLTEQSYQTDTWRSKTLRQMFGGLDARRMSADLIEQVFERTFAARKISGPTRNRYRALLSSVFAFAVSSGRLAVNPVARVVRHKEHRHRVRFLSADEEAALRAEVRKASPECEPLLDLALNTGLRRGEQFSLAWKDIDLEREVLQVRFGKTGARWVQINAGAREALLKLHRLSNGSAFVCPFAKRSGQRDWRRWFEDAVRDAGLDDFTWHDLRHTFASRLVMAGAQLYDVQRLLGHAKAEMTQRYAHLSSAHLRRTVGLLEPGAGAGEDSTATKQPLEIRKASGNAG